MTFYNRAMKPKVFFTDTSAKNKKGLPEKLKILFNKLKLNNIIEKDDLCAVKTHFGEMGNSAFVQGFFIRTIIDEIKKFGGKPFLTDGNTLYKGSRGNSVDHLITALKNGFAYATVEAPLIIADGLNGFDYVNVKIEGKHFQEVKIGSAAYEADCLITVSHFKGHEMTGFGGAIKNVGMGLGSRGAKQQMHSDAIPEVIVDKCNGCEKCFDRCPKEAIKINSDKASINRDLCYSCGECVISCPHEAIEINWDTDESVMQEKIVEHLLGALKGKEQKLAFVNFLTNITPEC
ncbi:MAG: DUF362 domain-containing protein, partial [Actinobacteria bacterium]